MPNAAQLDGEWEGRSVMIKPANAGRFAARMAALLAMLTMILALAPSVSAAPPSACEPFPGDTTIRLDLV